MDYLLLNVLVKLKWFMVLARFQDLLYQKNKQKNKIRPTLSKYLNVLFCILLRAVLGSSFINLFIACLFFYGIINKILKE